MGEGGHIRPIRKVSTLIRPIVAEWHMMPMRLYEDREGSKALVDDPLSTARSKPIDVRMHLLLELVTSGNLEVGSALTDLQSVNLLPKASMAVPFINFRQVL